MPPYGWRKPRYEDSPPDCFWLLERALSFIRHLMEERKYMPIVRLPPGGMPYRDIEREIILVALSQSSWVQRRAAKLLRISARMLNYKIKTLRLQEDSRWQDHHF